MDEVFARWHSMLIISFALSAVLLSLAINVPIPSSLYYLTYYLELFMVLLFLINMPTFIIPRDMLIHDSHYLAFCADYGSAASALVLYLTIFVWWVLLSFILTKYVLCWLFEKKSANTPKNQVVRILISLLVLLFLLFMILTNLRID